MSSLSSAQVKPAAIEVLLLQTSQEKSILQSETAAESIPFLGRDLLEHRVFLAAVREGKVVGVVSLVKDSRRIPGALGVGFISTHNEHRGQGVATALVEALFKLARVRRQAIANTSYEPDGERWLRPVMQRTAEAYPDVLFYERDQAPACA